MRGGRLPNIYECWEDREATFLIGGEVCTRRCDFCQIDTGKPAPLDRDEPRRVAESVQAMGLRYSTVTGVARDDLPDGGAWLYAETVRAIKRLNPSTGVELLIPDFSGEPAGLSRFSLLAQKCWRTTSKPCRVSSNGFARRLPISAASTCSPLPRLRLGHQEQPHPGPGRDTRGGAHRPGRSAWGGLRHRHHHPISAPVGAPPPGAALG
ncbi:putative lipoic acid synthetase [Mycobacterium xenopi 4042]|uniref:Putative lipoic acid synthetase n=1 Tax=Mycobacterium xenopi 4042 TaxID=1299334 RepID=X8DDE5_MYCXE|nr:putative lipoic acid synthetase [Mycobacterium xenopi 4042]